MTTLGPDCRLRCACWARGSFVCETAIRHRARRYRKRFDEQRAQSKACRQVQQRLDLSRAEQVNDSATKDTQEGLWIDGDFWGQQFLVPGE